MSRWSVIVRGLVLMIGLTGFHVRAQLADPTAPLGQSGATVTGAVVVAVPQLQAILVSGEQRVAIIDGARYQENDRVAGYRIRTIRAVGVVLEKAGTSLELQLDSLTGRLK